MATVATRRENNFLSEKNQELTRTQNSLDSDRPSHGRRLHQLRLLRGRTQFGRDGSQTV
jgi:hypothetical protein